MEELTYHTYYQYLDRGKYPDGLNKDEKRDIRKKCEPFCVKDGYLMHKRKINNEVQLRQVLIKTEVSRVIKACHEGFGGAHMGRDKTIGKITAKYYFKGIKELVSDYVFKCDKCQRASNKPAMQAPELHPVSVPENVWSQVGMDLIGPLPQTERGHCYIVAMTDYFTKFPVASPLKHKSAAEVAQFFLDTICEFGCIETLITDQGREFVNELNDIICAKLQIDHRIASAYHPQTNGLQERFNQTLERALIKCVNEKQDDWDLHIKRILFGYRTSVHASTGVTPFTAMFRRDPVLPVYLDTESCVAAGTRVTTAETVKELTERVLSEKKAADEKITLNIAKAQNRQKKNYDARHTSKYNEIVEGSLVLLRNNKNNHRMGGKLEAKYIGPYEVVTLLNKGRAKLKNVSSNKELKNLYHIVNLKIYKQNDTNGLSQDDITEAEPCNASVNEQQQIPEQMGVLHIPAEEKEILLMFADEKAVRRVEAEGKQVTEEEIETKPEKLPGMLVMRKQVLECVYKYMDEDAITTLHATIKAKEDDIPGAWLCQKCSGITADGREVVECESCFEWYHTACLGKTQNYKTSWTCLKCNPIPTSKRQRIK